MAPETTSASYPHPSSTSTSTLDGGPPSLPPVGFHVPPTSQSLPGFGELDAGFYASTSSAPYPPAIAPPAFNPGGGGAYQQQPHPPPSQGGVGSFPYPSPGLPLPQTSGSGGTHSPFSGYPPTPFSGGPPSYSPAAPTPHHPSLADPFSTVPLAHPHPSFSAPSISLPPPLSTTATSGGNLPPIGRIRCYWVLLSPQLEFVFLDPIMQHHLGEFRDKLLGTNLLDWVHPEEREQLAGDLLPATGEGEEVKGVEAGGVFGSVTRLRYSRMTRVLRHLGCAAPPSPPDAHTYTIDSEWLNLDLTTSWIAGDRKGKGKAGGGGGGGKGGAVLAFLHATEDKDTVSDNDSQNRTEWTNWCGPAVDYPGYLTPSQCEELVAALERVTSSSGGGGGEKAVKVEEAGEEGTVAGPPPHVYQILDAQGRPIVTFPRSNGGGRGGGGEGQGEKGEKVGESYDVEQFSMLAREVMARPRETIASRTSCTRRYRSKHPVMKDGTLTTIESVVVMYGAITFACFQTGGVYLRPTTTSTSSAASASSSGAPSTAGRKGRLSLITNGAQLHQHHPPTANDFALEDVPPTTPVAGTPHPNGNGVANGKRGSVGGEQNGGNSKSASMSPPTKRFKPSAPPPPPSSQPPQQPLSGLSIMTGGRLFRNTLDVEAITAGGISPTVASASAILGSFSADAHQLAQQHQQQQQQQQTQQPAHRQQQFSPNVTHSPSTGQASYSAFYNAQPPPPQPPTSFSPFDPPTISYSHSHSHPTPPLYGHSAPSYSPHPLSQAHAAPGYFSPAPVSPHDQSMSGPPSYPPIPTSQPFPSTDPTAFSSSAADHTSNNNLPPPPPPPSASASASATVIPLDPSQIPVPPPPPPHSQSGKKPPKQRPDGPVFKPNVKACESCGTVNSPEWRKGPTGAKSLCNACGLRYARSVARQKKQAEAAANGGVAPKGKGKKKTGKAAAAAAAVAAEKGVKPEGSPEGSSTPSLPPHSQPSPVHTSLPGGYDLSAYARASHKPYTPYHTTAPNFPGSFAPVMPSPTTSQPSPFHSPLPPTTSSAYFPAMGYSAAPPFSGAPLPIPITTHSPLPPPPPPTYGDYSHSSSFGSSSAGATSHAPHLPGISSHHFNASVSPHPHPHLHSPHLEHPPPPQHSPLESPATASGGMFRSSSQGGALSQAPPQPSYQTYDWRHEQAEGGGGGGVGHERGEPGQ